MPRIHVCAYLVPAHLLTVAGIAVVTVVCNALIFFFMVLWVPIQHNITIPSSTVSIVTDTIKAIIRVLSFDFGGGGIMSVRLIVQLSLTPL